ncbi:MAG: DUF1800 family protein [Akkermansiaceae bacterium]
MMKSVNLIFLALCGELAALPLAEFSGETDSASNPTADYITEYLTFGISGSGDVGSNIETGRANTGYWIDSSNTTTGTSNTTISNSFTFTATGVDGEGLVDVFDISFDYVRMSLNGALPVMDIFVDTGDGYGDSVYTVDDNPTNGFQIDAHKVPIYVSLKNGESITIGFSFGDNKGSPARTHLIDNLVLSGGFDFNLDFSGVDLNLNGVSDLWEYRYNASSLVEGEATKNLDYDGDGLTNLEEARAGTNPFDATSLFGLKFNRDTDANSEFRLPSILGKEYTIYGSDSLELNSWAVDMTGIEGSGDDILLEMDTSVFSRYFYRAEVTDVDLDNDGLTRWEELNSLGFDDSDGNSGGNAIDDYLRMKLTILSANASELTISTNSSTLYEEEGLPVEVIFTRTDYNGDRLVDLETVETFQITDTTKVASNAASSGDYKILDENDEELVNGNIVFLAGEASKTVKVVAVADSEVEPDEQLTLSIEGGEDLDLWIADKEQVSSETYIALSQAGHFLSQASMGGTPESITELANDILELGHLPACEAWIDAQLTAPRESTVTDDCYTHQALYLESNPTPSVNIQNFELVWWGKVVQSEEQFRHRMAFSLSQVFVTSAAFWANEERNDLWRSYTCYYDKLMDEAYSTHRELLTTISYDPFMGVYLSSAQNRKADSAAGTSPDENYAREVMQLFSCGVYLQDQNGNYVFDENDERIENYDNEDITELAKVFTGLGLTNEEGELANFNSPNSNRGTRYEHPMLMSEEYHETSAKTLLEGTVIPAGQSGDADISDALDVLAEHPSTAPHLSRLLIKRLTNSNPSSAYMGRVVEAWNGTGPYGTGEVGNFVSIFKAILLDTEARNAIEYSVDNNTDLVTISPALSTAGRIKEPILKWLQFYRFSQVLSGEDDGLMRFEPLTKRAANDQTPDFGQIPMRAPSVFNYYDSYYSPALGALAEAEATTGLELTSPESEILSPFVIKQFESFYEIVNQDNPTTSFTYLANDSPVLSIEYSYMAYLYQKNQSVGDFIDDVNLWLCNGAISEELKQDLITLTDADDGSLQEQFAKVITVIFNSSDFSVSY